MESVKLGPLRDAVGIVEPFSQLAKFDGFDKICCILDISNGVNDFVFVEKIVVFVVKVLLENVKFKPLSHVILRIIDKYRVILSEPKRERNKTHGDSKRGFYHVAAAVVVG